MTYRRHASRQDMETPSSLLVEWELPFEQGMFHHLRVYDGPRLYIGNLN